MTIIRFHTAKVNPSLPDANRLGFSGGFDFKVSPKFGISASYLFIRSEETQLLIRKKIILPAFLLLMERIIQ